VIADELRRDHGLGFRILPMSNDPCPTFVSLTEGKDGGRDGGRRVHFEEYLVRDGAPNDVRAVDLGAAAGATAAPGVVDAIARADLILVAPSNPIVSIGPIRAVPEIRRALDTAACPVVAVSPIVGGLPIKGPAHTLMRACGIEVSARGVAALYRDWIDGFVFDTRDAAARGEIEALGLDVEMVDTLMVDAAASRRVAEAAIRLGDRLR
jgi:LPPG:FO 2-phospho-L-lactate transferase